MHARHKAVGGSLRHSKPFGEPSQPRTQRVVRHNLKLGGKLLDIIYGE